MGLYVMDYDALAEIAVIIGKGKEAGELQKSCPANLKSSSGHFCHKWVEFFISSLDFKSIISFEIRASKIQP